jgi:L-aspartate oxidase
VRQLGVIRDGAGLAQAASDVEFWRRYVLAREFDGRPGWELQNLLTVARLTIDSARRREESRGVHFRTDFPQPDDERWKRHIVCPAPCFSA